MDKFLNGKINDQSYSSLQPRSRDYRETCL